MCVANQLQLGRQQRGRSDAVELPASDASRNPTPLTTTLQIALAARAAARQTTSRELIVTSAERHAASEAMKGSVKATTVAKYAAKGMPVFKRYLHESRGWTEDHAMNEFLECKATGQRPSPEEMSLVLAGYVAWLRSQHLEQASHLPALRWHWNSTCRSDDFFDAKAVKEGRWDKRSKRLDARMRSTNALHQEKQALSAEMIVDGIAKYFPSVLDDALEGSGRPEVPDDSMAFAAGLLMFSYGIRGSNAARAVSGGQARQGALAVADASASEEEVVRIQEILAKGNTIRACDVVFGRTELDSEKWYTAFEWSELQTEEIVSPTAVGLSLLTSKVNQIGAIAKELGEAQGLPVSLFSANSFKRAHVTCLREAGLNLAEAASVTQH